MGPPGNSVSDGGEKMLEKRRILLGVTGGIAAYKAAELTRELIRRGASVKIVMTRNATEFITPLTLQTLSGNPVYLDTFSLTGDWRIGHISLVDEADLLVIAPATANIIGKIACGIADDLLSTTVMAAAVPVLLCPSMNTNMYGSAAVRENLEKLRERGTRIMEPDRGGLACGTEGAGRLPSPADVADEIESILTPKDLEGERVLVTAGPTREPLDPVRYISNYSSGKMGYALAAAAAKRGARVVLVSGPTALAVPRGVTAVPVSSAVEMRERVLEHLEDSTVVIKAAAVADYRPARLSTSKIKKSGGGLSLDLERNPDIISEVGRNKGDRVLVGFAMETDDLVPNARKKLVEKNMDLIVANDLGQPGSGFQYDTNIVRILDREGNAEELPMMDKTDVAHRILDRIGEIARRRKAGPGGERT